MSASGLIAFLLISIISVVNSMPVRTSARLDAAATAEAQQRDNTATRAFTATEIKTSDSQCLFVDPTSGDFRENLTPVQIKPCDGSAGQKWDLVTAGKHNNQPGFALIVSSLTNACLNFDPRRAASNQVILFSCGGRADGGGAVADSQLFPFKNGQTSLALQPKAGNNAICLTPINGLLGQSACSTAIEQVFTFGSSPSIPGSGGSSTPSPSPTNIAAPSNTPISNTSASSGVKTGVKLDPAAAAEAQQRDNTATRAFSNAPIKTSDGQCLFVDPTSGDFRENLTPVQTKPCDSSDGQKWDLITSGKHNDQPGFALVVSSLTNACLNFDDRRPAGNQVVLFSCGGRADGSGQVQDAQLFPFKGEQTTIVLRPKKGNNVCLAPHNGLLSGASCSGGSDQTFTIGGGQAPPTPTPTSSTPAGTTPTPAPSPTSKPPVLGVKTGVKLDEAAIAEAQQRDNTATRAFTGAAIKTLDGQCLFVDPTSGDFRENLTPVQIKPCDGGAGQRWDIIMAGKHNDKPGFALIVSSLTNACLNFDDRRAPGNQVILFSCGGRADGSGQVQNAQLFPFKNGKTTLALLPQNANNLVCLAPVNGLLDKTACSGAASANGNQIFTVS